MGGSAIFGVRLNLSEETRPILFLRQKKENSRFLQRPMIFFFFFFFFLMQNTMSLWSPLLWYQIDSSASPASSRMNVN